MGLRQYQLEACCFLHDKKKAALFLNMGLGKTLITLTVLNKLVREKNRFLIIAPLYVVKHVWKQELEKWDHLKDIKMVTIDGSPEERIKKINSNANVFLINKELISWYSKAIKDKKVKWRFAGLVVDESSCFKDRKGKRFRSIASYAKYFKYVFLLTGTPIVNSVVDLWSQIYLIDTGERLHDNFRDFLKTYKLKPIGMDRYDVQNDQRRLIFKKIKDVCYRVNANLPIPDKIEYNINVDNDIEMYDKLMHTSTIGDMKFGDGMDATLTKLHQYTGGAIYIILYFI